MSRKLSAVNPFLRDPAARRSMLIRSVVTSSAIEGIHVVFDENGKVAGKAPVRKGSRVSRKKA
jgi:hypothetical protein